MKNIIVATAIAIASVVAYAPSSFADTVTVAARHNDHRNYHRPNHRHCFTKTVKSYHHGRVVYAKKRICR
jgi:hypothetical protein